MTAVSRRRFFQAAAGAAAAAALPTPAPAADAAAPLKFQLGLVTYNVAAKWTRDDILKACKAAKLAATL